MDRRRAIAHIGLMNPALDKVTSEALELPNAERLALAHTLLESVEPPCSSDVEGAWDDIIRRRIDEIDSGKIESIPWNQVKEEAEDRLAGDRWEVVQSGARSPHSKALRVRRRYDLL
jgi:putative addiction module component (TIGR02574 family)